MENKWKVNEETKKLVYVEIYEQLYNMIMDGTFPVGSRLPSEPKLAQALGVSRMTLRQALGLLHDDGLLRKIQGAGNFVMKGKKAPGGNLGEFAPPVRSCCGDKITRMEMEFRLEVPAEFTVELLKRKSPVVVAMDRWYYAGENPIAFTFSTIPVETISAFGLDLNDKEGIREFAENGVYEKGRRAELQLEPNSEGVVIVKNRLKKGAHVTLMEEYIYGDDCFPLLHNKHYILTEEASFTFRTEREK